MAEHGSEGYSVALLGSPLAVMRAERLLREQGLAVKAIPVPREVSSDCGICLRFLPADEGRIRELLGQHGVGIVGVHEL
ncbi:MAG: DUF3343 domain-containing protein [Chloroflexota bacterium]